MSTGITLYREFNMRITILQLKAVNTFARRRWLRTYQLLKLKICIILRSSVPYYAKTLAIFLALKSLLSLINDIVL